MRERIAEKIGESRYRTWFADSAEISIDEHNVDLSVPSRFVGDWIAGNYLPQVIASASELLGTTASVRIHVAGKADAVAAPIAAKRSPRSRRVELKDGSTAEVATATSDIAEIPLPPSSGSTLGAASGAPRPAAKIERRRPQLRGDLSQFVVGNGNELAFNAARRAISELSDAYRPLVIHGGVGLGKTHLLEGICNAVAREQPLLTWAYVSGENFTNDFIGALRNQREQAFRDRFRSVDVLVVDDVHFLEGKRATQIEFLHTFNAVDAAGKAIIMSSDRHPRHLTALLEPLQDRLGKGTVVQVQPPDLETRREILRRRALSMGRKVPSDVIDYLAQHVTTNVRALEGALYRLLAFVSLSEAPLSVAGARSAFPEFEAPSEGAPLSSTALIDAVGEYFGVTRAMLLSAARDRLVSGARSCAMYLMRKHQRMSLPQIGKLFGDKNHTTVLHATRRVEAQLGNDAPLLLKTTDGAAERPIRRVLADLERQLGLSAMG
ncbi:MAG: chromosomal replication initiator protein DnaA [Phycisphaerae bacterium]|nr:chromosomal replication initiator protein DnaA [Phycisphaerae bacterium]